MEPGDTTKGPYPCVRGVTSSSVVQRRQLWPLPMREGSDHMSEVEEASRVVIMLGQLLVPGAQELARLLARAVDDALSRLDGHGSLA